LNPHASRRQNLNLVRLPFRHTRWDLNSLMAFGGCGELKAQKGSV
jgi:hypothetical protein